MRSKIRYKGTSAEVFFSTNEYDFTALVTYSYYYEPAKLDGPWEDCYPEDESFEYEIESIDFDGDEQHTYLTNIEMLRVLGSASIVLDNLQVNTDLIKNTILDLNETICPY